MPPKPDIPTRWNYVIESLVDPCDAPWTLWVRTALRALLEALIWWLAFDLYQMVSAYARPRNAFKYMRSNRKSGKGEKAGRAKDKNTLRKYLSGALEFDPSAELGKRWPGADFFNGRRVGMGEATFWIAEGAVQRAFFYWAVVELGTQFFYRWSTLLNDTKFCQASRTSVLLADDPDGHFAIAGHYSPLSVYNVLKLRGGVTHFPSGMATSETAGQFGVSVPIIERGEFAGPCRLYIFRDNVDFSNPIATASLTGLGSLDASVSVDQPGVYQAFIFAEGDFVRCGNSVMYYHGAPPRLAPRSRPDWLPANL